MLVNEFKVRLAAQGVELEAFINNLKPGARKAPCHFIRNAREFFDVINHGFTWAATAEGHHFWEGVANERRTAQIVMERGATHG